MLTPKRKNNSLTEIAKIRLENHFRKVTESTRSKVK